MADDPAVDPADVVSAADLARGVVCLMCGVAGSGKTTWAKRLESRGMVRLSIDEEVWHASGGPGDDDPETDSARHHAALAHLDARLEELLALGTPVVLDYSFWSRAERDRYKQLIVRHERPWRLLVLRVDPVELRRRLTERERTSGPNAVVVGDELLAAYVAGFEWPSGEGEVELGAGDLVRRGYDAVSHAYRGDDEAPPAYREWVETLLRRLPAAPARVLDLGCGCGVPLARDLARAGHDVTGVDFSAVQIDRARRLTPAATFLRADLTTVEFDSDSFDAVVCLYTLIHLADHDQRRTLTAIGTWLRPGGTFLATVGVHAVTGTDPDWWGTGTAMWWNQPDLDVARGWVRDAGLTVESEWFVPESDTSGHQALLARRPMTSSAHS